MIEEDKPAFRVFSLNSISNNANGETYEFLNQGGAGMLIAYRKEGSMSGNHYHKGEVDAKNPEQLILQSGKVEISATSVLSGRYVKEMALAPCRVEVYPNYRHSLLAITDIVFIELNSLDEHIRDTHYE
jgi:hypothetical protein